MAPPGHEVLIVVAGVHTLSPAIHEPFRPRHGDVSRKGERTTMRQTRTSELVAAGTLLRRVQIQAATRLPVYSALAAVLLVSAPACMAGIVSLMLQLPASSQPSGRGAVAWLQSHPIGRLGVAMTGMAPCTHNNLHPALHQLAAATDAAPSSQRATTAPACGSKRNKQVMHPAQAADCVHRFRCSPAAHQDRHGLGTADKAFIPLQPVSTLAAST
jgi:hypothetical protein